MHTEASKQAHRPGSEVRETDQRKILAALKNGPKTLYQLGVIIGKPNSTVSARLDLLQRIGFVFLNDYISAYELVPHGYESATGREYRRRITIARAKTLLNEPEFLPPYLIDAVNRYLMDNGEKPRIYPEPDKFTESQTKPDKFTGA